MSHFRLFEIRCSCKVFLFPSNFISIKGDLGEVDPPQPDSSPLRVANAIWGSCPREKRTMGGLLPEASTLSPVAITGSLKKKS